MRPQKRNCKSTRNSKRLFLLLFAQGLFWSVAQAEFAALAPDEADDADEMESLDSEADAIISEKDQIELVEDASVAEAIDRRPDISFSNVNIDGEGSGISLDSISADQIESVEVLKAVTPDLDADSRGGSVSLRTKPSYEARSVSAKGSLETSYSSQDGNLGYNGSFSVGGPIVESRKWGGRMSFRWSDSSRSYDGIFHDWDVENVNGLDRFVIEDTRLSSYNSDSSSKEISLSLDRKLGEDWSLYARSNFETREREILQPKVEYLFSSGDYLSVDDGNALISEGKIRRGMTYYDETRDELEISTGADLRNDFLDAEFKYTLQESDSHRPIQLGFDFVMQDVDLQYEIEDSLYPLISHPAGMDLNDSNAYQFEDLSLRNRLSDATDDIAAVNLKFKNLFADERSFFKFGLKSRNREETNRYESRVYDEFDGVYTLNSVVSDFVMPGFLDGRYLLDAMPSNDLALDFLDQNSDDFILNERRTREASDPNTYLAEEGVDAYYGMFNWVSGKWRTILGYRYEDTSVAFNGNDVVIGEDGNYQETLPAVGDNSYGNAFPNAHLGFRASDSLSIIASYTETIKRPWYGDIVPTRSVDLEDRELEEGNPGLRPTLYANWDLSADFKFADENMLSFEVFQRSISDFVFSRKSIVSGGVYDGFELERKENSGSATIQGGKLTWQQPLRGYYIPDGLSLNVNYIYQSSEIEYPDRPLEILPLAYTPEQELNVTFNYQSEKVFAQLKYDYVSSQYARVGESAVEDRFTASEGNLDLMASYQLRDKVRWYVELDSLNNPPLYLRYDGDPSRPSGYRESAWRSQMGVKFEL